MSSATCTARPVQGRGDRTRPAEDRHPACPGCGKTPSRIAGLPDGGLVGLCECGTWTAWELSAATERLMIVERRGPDMRRRAGMRGR